MKIILSLGLLSLVFLHVQSVSLADPLDNVRSVYSELYKAEYLELTVNDTKAFVVKPRHLSANQGKPWIWYAPSLRRKDGTWELPAERHAELVQGLLGKGFYFCGIDIGESYGSPASMKLFTQFYHLLVDKYQFSPQVCLFPVSRGGLMHFNWAIEHPEWVQCIGGIYPVSNLKSYPGIGKVSEVYGVPPDQLQAQTATYNPVDRLEGIARARIPILILHGDNDKLVPIEQNSALFASRLNEAGGKMELIVIKDKGHEFAPEFWNNPRLEEFFLKYGLVPRE